METQTYLHEAVQSYGDTMIRSAELRPSERAKVMARESAKLTGAIIALVENEVRAAHERINALEGV